VTSDLFESSFKDNRNESFLSPKEKEKNTHAFFPYAIFQNCNRIIYAQIRRAIIRKNRIKANGFFFKSNSSPLKNTN